MRLYLFVAGIFHLSVAILIFTSNGVIGVSQQMLPPSLWAYGFLSTATLLFWASSDEKRPAKGVHTALVIAAMMAGMWTTGTIVVTWLTQAEPLRVVAWLWITFVHLYAAHLWGVHTERAQIRTKLAQQLKSSKDTQEKIEQHITCE